MARKLRKSKAHDVSNKAIAVRAGEFWRQDAKCQPPVIVPPLRSVEWNIEAAARVGYESFLRLAEKDKDLNMDARIVGWDKLDPDIRANWKILAREVVTAALKPT